MEQTNRLILNDLIQAYKDQYGDDNWFNSLTRNLYPSPNQAIAARHGVSKTRVIRMKHELWKLGLMIRELANLPPLPELAQPLEPIDPVQLTDPS
uniref:Uncharacterized protein n=1 Tax=viral metagenome TaxID=1070528 RepID=A0A6C0K7F7_9ZZZZ